MDAAELRKRFPTLTAHVSDADVEALLAALEERAFPVGSKLVRHGEHADTLFLLLDGRANVHVVAEGQDLLLGQAGPGAVVGEVGLIEPGPASATVEALEPTTTLALRRDRFLALSQSSPAAASALLRALSRELVERIRSASDDVVRRIDDHHWMRAEAEKDKPRWFRRIAALVRGAEA